MEQLPKLVREQLRANSTVESHPDADLLTAYLEQSLTARERLQVNDHLAGCSECRQIVSLATPETVSAILAGEAARVSGKIWLRWPVLRWGAVAACVVVVGGAVVMHVTRKAGTQARNSTEQAAQLMEPAPSAQVEAKAIPPSSTMVRVEPSPRRESKNTKPGLSQALGGGTGGGVFRVAPAQATKEQQSANARTMLSRTDNLDAVVVENAVPPESTSNAVTDKTDLKTSGANVAAAPAPSPPPGGQPSNKRAIGNVTETVEVTAEAPTLQGENANVANVPSSTNKELSKQAVHNEAVVNFSPKPLPEVAATTKGMADFKAPRWTLSEKGLPQRSFDSGKTWEEVQVDHKNGFRALSAVGMDVWVGGKNGLLYHTSDMGLHWTPITPSSSGTSLSVDIVRIEFADPLHGRLIAGDGQSWVTLDGGKTWKKQ